MNSKTIGEHISAIRTILRIHTDDTPFTDEFLYSLMISARAVLLERKSKNWNEISDTSKLTICLPLCKDFLHDCVGCIGNVGCEVLKGTQIIPNVLVGRNRELIEVYDVNGSKLNHMEVSQWRNLQYSKSRKLQPVWDLFNNELVLFNSSLELVIVQGVFEDPIALRNYDCDTSGTPCFDPTNSVFPLEPSLSMPMYELVMEKMGFSFQIQTQPNNNLITVE